MAYVLVLTYVRPLDEVDPLVDEHMAWVGRHYDSGLFRTSGRREPRTGGVILTADRESAEIEAVLAEDPFVREGVGEYEVVRYLPSRAAPGLDGMLDA